jgi:hypothetical protein
MASASNVRHVQCIFGERSINMSGSFAKIFAPNLFSFDKGLCHIARFRIFPKAFPIDIISADFESVLSVNSFTNYLQRVRPSAFSKRYNVGSIPAGNVYVIVYLEPDE